MLSRILWISVAGIALLAGIAFQDGGRFLSWDDGPEPSRKSERTVEAQIDRAIDRSFDKMSVTGSDGQEIEMPAETKRELAGAVSRLVKAEADLAMLRIGDASDEELKSARDRIADARADIDRVKAQIKKAEQAATIDGEALSEQIRSEVREDVRASLREAARN